MVGGSTDVGLTTQRGARCEWGLPGGAPLVTLAPLLPGPAAAPRHRPPRPLAHWSRPLALLRRGVRCTVDRGMDVGLPARRGARCEWGLPGDAPLVTLASRSPMHAAAQGPGLLAIRFDPVRSPNFDSDLDPIRSSTNRVLLQPAVAEAHPRSLAIRSRSDSAPVRARSDPSPVRSDLAIRSGWGLKMCVVLPQVFSRRLHCWSLPPRTRPTRQSPRTMRSFELLAALGATTICPAPPRRQHRGSAVETFGSFSSLWASSSALVATAGSASKCRRGRAPAQVSG